MLLTLKPANRAMLMNAVYRSLLIGKREADDLADTPLEAQVVEGDRAVIDKGSSHIIYRLSASQLECPCERWQSKAEA